MVKVLRDVGLNYILLNPGSGVIHCSEHSTAVLSLLITNLHFCKLGSASQQTKNYVLLFSLQTCWRSTDQLRVGYFVWSDEAGIGARRWGLDGGTKGMSSPPCLSWGFIATCGGSLHQVYWLIMLSIFSQYLNALSIVIVKLECGQIWYWYFAASTVYKHRFSVLWRRV